jgi:hypothetical protein
VLLSNAFRLHVAKRLARCSVRTTPQVMCRLSTAKGRMT